MRLDHLLSKEHLPAPLVVGWVKGPAAREMFGVGVLVGGDTGEFVVGDGCRSSSVPSCRPGPWGLGGGWGRGVVVGRLGMVGTLLGPEGTTTPGSRPFLGGGGGGVGASGARHAWALYTVWWGCGFGWWPGRCPFLGLVGGWWVWVGRWL